MPALRGRSTQRSSDSVAASITRSRIPIPRRSARTDHAMCKGPGQFSIAAVFLDFQPPLTGEYRIGGGNVNRLARDAGRQPFSAHCHPSGREGLHSGFLGIPLFRSFLCSFLVPPQAAGLEFVRWPTPPVTLHSLHDFFQQPLSGARTETPRN